MSVSSLKINDKKETKPVKAIESPKNKLSYKGGIFVDLAIKAALYETAKSLLGDLHWESNRVITSDPFLDKIAASACSTYFPENGFSMDVTFEDCEAIMTKAVKRLELVTANDTTYLSTGIKRKAKWLKSTLVLLKTISGKKALRDTIVNKIPIAYHIDEVLNYQLDDRIKDNDLALALFLTLKNSIIMRIPKEQK